MITDLRGTLVSSADPKALELYEKALRQYQSYVGDPVATIDEVLAERPDFVLGHAFRAGVLMTFAEQRAAEQARISVVRAEALLARANDRERGLVSAARRLVDGDWGGACAAYDRVLVEEPRDAFALQTAHLFDFYRGDALNLRNRVSRVLPRWSAELPGYSYVLGMHAFGLEESNQYPEAERAAREALALEPRDGWAVHAAAHVMEMQGRIDEGIHWLTSRAADWAPDNGFAFHNWWHLALFHLDRGDVARVLELYDTAIYPTPGDQALQLVDATALLWRLYLLAGAPEAELRSRFEAVADVWHDKLAAERGFYAFNDVHALMAFAALRREDDVARLLHDMDAACASNTLNAAMTRDVGQPLARGILAFAEGRYEEAVRALEPIRDSAHRFGGSHAQRDLISLTLIEALLRAGHLSLARHYVAERNVHRPSSALGWRLHARTLR